MGAALNEQFSRIPSAASDVSHVGHAFRLIENATRKQGSSKRTGEYVGRTIFDLQKRKHHSKATMTSSHLRAESGHEQPARRLLCGATIAIMITLYARPQNISGEIILAVGTVLIFGLLVRERAHPRILVMPWLLVAVAAMSMFWGEDSATVLTRTIALAAPLVLAGIIANCMPFDRFLAIADRTFKVLILTSIFVGIAVPAVGLTQDAILHGTFRGIFVHRNPMGYIVVLATITLLARHWGARGPRTGTLLWLGIYLFAFLWTGSAGAIALIATSFGIYGFARWISRQRQIDRAPLLISMVFLAMFAAIFSIPYVSKVLGLFDRDLTFTNRTSIWRGAIQAWEDRFWLGYGWGEILGPEDEAANVIKRSAGWLVTSTHNGYLSTALQIGAIGLIVSIAFLVSVFFSALKQTIESPGPQAVWSLQIVSILIIGDATETRAFVNIGWFFLCLIAYYSLTSKTEEGDVPGNLLVRDEMPER